MNEIAPEPVFSTEITVRWGDMDAYAHLNNTVYLRFMEEARIQMLYEMGYTLDGKGQGPVIINAFSTFLKPVVYPDTLTVDCFVGEPGRSSFMSYYSLYSQAQDDELVCEGSAKIVWIDTETNSSVPLPQDIRLMIESKER